MLTSELTVHMLKCNVRGHVCCPLIYDSSFILSFIRLFVRSFVRSFVRACVRACVRAFVRSFVRSFIHSFIIIGPLQLAIHAVQNRLLFSSMAVLYHVNRELKMETFSGRRRPDWQRKPGTEAAVASRQKSNVKIAVNSEGRRL